MTVGGIAGERTDNQHDGAGGQPHQGRQQGPRRVQVRGGSQYLEPIASPNSLTQTGQIFTHTNSPSLLSVV